MAGMLRRLSLWLGLISRSHALPPSSSRRRKDKMNHHIKGPPSFLSETSFKSNADSTVRIIHAGGFVELYKFPIPASLLLDKYPGMCIARPDVFKRPHDSLLHPGETLPLGYKFFLIPYSTIRKLKRKYPRTPRKDREVAKVAVSNQSCQEGDAWDSDFSEESVSLSANDFFTSREDDWSNGSLTRKCQERAPPKKKPFVFTPPIKRSRTFHKLEWQPSLTSVQELSPYV
ncbi:hypothetical protein Scep_017919 [Stephania cephalantha]|uniref:Uncharacterized protein n=1 Tax=Stephania cephalantha TaxID=152367 RepID=A0AAP0IQG0_9MAGN